jgi:hypothetical protein
MSTAKRLYKRAMSLESDKRHVRCVCGATDDVEDSDEAWIACGSCHCWQHYVCMGIDMTDGGSPAEYKCEICAPGSHKELLKASARGEKLWEDRRTYIEATIEEETPKRRDIKNLRKGAKVGKDSTRGNNLNDVDETPVHKTVITSFPLTEECHHYTSIAGIPWDIQK